MAAATLVMLCAFSSVEAQTTALRGRVFDESGAVIPAAVIGVRDDSTGFAVSVLTDQEGHYVIAALPAGTYAVTAKAPGFRTEIIRALNVDVGRTLVRNFLLVVGERNETVLVRAEIAACRPGNGHGRPRGHRAQSFSRCR